MSDSITFGAWLKVRREETGMTIRELSQTIGMSAPYLEELENGKRCPPPEEKLKQIAKILKLSIEDEFTLFDLASAGRDSNDMSHSEFIKCNGYMLYALRKATSSRRTFLDVETRAAIFARSFPFLPEQ